MKNGEDSERWNAISISVANTIKDYVDGPRYDHVDENGQEPLFTTTVGRPHSSTIRNTLYRATRPCWYGERCPHERNPDECEAMDEKS